MSAEISIIVPAYNSGRTLEIITRQLITELRKIKKSFELIIAEDGSTDNTYQLAKSISKSYENVRLIHSDKKLGKGGALKNAFPKSKGKKIIFIDADYIDVPKFLPQMVSRLNEFDIVIGSRYQKPSRTRRIFRRLVASKVYIILAKLFFYLPFSDLQCGFKGINKRVVGLMKNVRSKDYFWDTEFLVKANRAGYTISEIPITWFEKKAKHSASLVKDSFKFAKSLIKLRLGLL